LPGRVVGSDKQAVVVEDSLVAGDRSWVVVGHKPDSRPVVVRKVGVAELVVAVGPLEEAVEAELVAPLHLGRRVVELDFVPFDRQHASNRR
jgi:hypothetical protein